MHSKNSNSLKILFVGDFCPINEVEQYVKLHHHGAGELVLGDLLTVFNAADYRVVNLECVISELSSPIAKSGPVLKAIPETLSLLKETNFNLATIANNHVFDHGDGGIRSTIANCHKYGIATVGAGASLEDASKTFYAEINGSNVAFICFAENEYNSATGTHGGSNPLDIIDIFNQLTAARKKADIVIAIAHGGHEHFHYPSPRTVKLYRFMAENGAHAVIGHHPHCIQGIEERCGVPIFYSLGNFVFPSRGNFPGHFEGYIVMLEFGNRKCTYKILPYEQCRDKIKVELLKGKAATDFDQRLRDLSGVIANPESLLRKWHDFASVRSLSYLNSLIPAPKRIKALFWRLGMGKFLLPQRFVLNLLNFIRCESHRDILINSLIKYLKNTNATQVKKHSTCVDRRQSPTNRDSENGGW